MKGTMNIPHRRIWPAVSRQPYGFTLSELIVAVLIFAILVAIALPVFQQVKRADALARCTSNLKTLGSVLAQYLADHNGQFPPSRKQSRRNPRQPEERIAAPFLPDVFSRYTSVTGWEPLWRCPGDVERPPEKYKYSYAHNEHLGGSKATPVTWDGQPNEAYDARYAYIHAVEKPLSEVIFLADFVNRNEPGKWSTSLDGGYWPMRPGSTRNDPDPGRMDLARHGDRANLLFVDGSVRAFTFDQLVESRSRYIIPVMTP